jgi:entericidin B
MKILSVIIALTAASYLTACNTMAGFGKDLQKSGEALERSAERN